MQNLTSNNYIISYKTYGPLICAFLLDILELYYISLFKDLILEISEFKVTAKKFRDFYLLNYL